MPLRLCYDSTGAGKLHAYENFEHFKEKKPLTATRYKQASSFILIQKFMTMQLREKTDNLFCSAPKNLHLVDNMHNHQCSI